MNCSEKFFAADRRRSPARRRRAWTAASGDAGQQQQRPGGNAPAAAACHCRFDQSEQLIDEQRKQRRGDAAEQHRHPILDLQARENVVAEARLAHGRRQRRRADHPDGAVRTPAISIGRRAAARRAIVAAVRHADAACGFDHGWIEIDDAGHAVADHRQHRIERQCKQRRQEAERGEPDAEEVAGERRKRQQQRVEQSEQRQARDRSGRDLQMRAPASARAAAHRRDRRARSSGPNPAPSPLR